MNSMQFGSLEAAASSHYTASSNNNIIKRLFKKLFLLDNLDENLYDDLDVKFERFAATSIKCVNIVMFAY